MTQRRDFLRQMTLFSAVFATGAAGRAAVTTRPTAAADEMGLSFARFSRVKSTEFQVRGAHRTALRLQQVERHERGPQIENFTALFEAPAVCPLEQGTHVFQHDELGTFEMFVVAKPQADRTVYEAVFNRLV